MLEEKFFEFCGYCAIGYKSESDYRIFRFGQIVTSEEIYNEKLCRYFESVSLMELAITQSIKRRV
jgi:hypothetical protein